MEHSTFLLIHQCVYGSSAGTELELPCSAGSSARAALRSRGQRLVGVEDPLGVQHGFELLHEHHCLAWFAVLNELLLLEAQPVLCTDAPATSCSPLIHKGLDGIQQGMTVGLRRDVQVQVPISWKKTLHRWVWEKNLVALQWILIPGSSTFSNNRAFVRLQTVQEGQAHCPTNISLSMHK